MAHLAGKREVEMRLFYTRRGGVERKSEATDVSGSFLFHHFLAGRQDAAQKSLSRSFADVGMIPDSQQYAAQYFQALVAGAGFANLLVHGLRHLLFLDDR